MTLLRGLTVPKSPLATSVPMTDVLLVLHVERHQGAARLGRGSRWDCLSVVPMMNTPSAEPPVL
jgi:hypothetical protein